MKICAVERGTPRARERDRGRERYKEIEREVFEAGVSQRSAMINMFTEAGGQGELEPSPIHHPPHSSTSGYTTNQSDNNNNNNNSRPTRSSVICVHVWLLQGGYYSTAILTKQHGCNCGIPKSIIKMPHDISVGGAKGQST